MTAPPNNHLSLEPSPILTGSVVKVSPGVGNPDGERSPILRDGSARATLSGFITDGSIARLCDEMARLAGVPIWLRDADGRVIIPCDADDSTGGRNWRCVESHEGASRAFSLVGRAFDARADLFVAPLRLSVGEIGAIVMTADWGVDNPVQRRALERAVTLLASTAAESCQEQLALQHRADELSAMFRLSSMLVRATEPGTVLESALEIALDVLNCDAGSISVIEPDGTLLHRAARGLSPAWLQRSRPLSVDGTIRAAALSGEVVCIENIQRDPRILEPERPKGEGLISLALTGLMYQGRAAGLIRLYTRTPREFSQEDRRLLRSIADHAAMVLAHATLRQLRQEDQQIKRQVRIAADVQRRMLPQRLPEVPPFDLAARYAPSFHLGGDFYDLFERRGRLALAVCDVVGKGVPAALLMSAVRASLRAHTLDIDQLDEVMSRLNKAMVRDTLEGEFATLWLAMADPITLRLTYCGAGHDPPLIFRVPEHRPPRMEDVDELLAGGMVLGIDPSQRYQLGQFDLRPRDVLLAYTDGLSEAMNFEGRTFGRERIKAAVLELLSRPEAQPGGARHPVTAAAIVEHLTAELRNYCGVKAAADDVTILAMRVLERPPQGAAADFVGI
ncbi:MAG: PP2C family protein-serine/threonine phosphatase [Phycisphaerales bacterium]